MEQREYIVEAEGAGQRIDRFLSGEDTGLSRSALQGLVAEGHVLCNGKAPAKSLKLKAGDIILLEIPDAKPIEAVPQEIPLDIIYEDAHLLVVNKPKGMVVHPAPGNPDGTLVNALLWHCKGRAFTSVPSGLPGAGWTTMPLGLFTTRRWSSSYTMSSGMSCGTASIGFASGISSRMVSPALSLRLLAMLLPLQST